MDVGTRNHWSPALVVPSRELAARIHARWPIAPREPRTTAAKSPSATPSRTAAARSASSPRCRSRSAATARARGFPPTARSTPACSPRRARTCARRCAPARATTSCSSSSAASGPGGATATASCAPRMRDAAGPAQGRDELHRRLMAKRNCSRTSTPRTARPWWTWAPRRPPGARPPPRPWSNYRRRWRASSSAPGTARRRARCSTPPSSPASWPRRGRTRSIPFCHPLPLERCSVDIATGRAARMRIVCSVAVHHKTGVEMEALMGATAAALTIYDMCKALSHDIEIGPVRLLGKTRRQAQSSQARRPRGANRHERASGTVVWPGARGRPQHAHAARQGRARIPGRRNAARLGDETARAARGARVRLGARRPKQRARPRAATRRSSIAATSKARSPASARRWPSIRKSRGWCSPATCPSSMRARSTH